MEFQKKWISGKTIMVVAVIILTIVLMVSCNGGDDADDAANSIESTGISADASAIAESRGLTPDDIAAALKTYTPSGVHDDYIMFASGGHGGQVYVIGVPSMRIIKQIAVFTPEPWQGYGYGAEGTMEVLAGGNVEGNELTWGDTHHTALSETDGDYDGEYLFINDKANGRIAVIDLKDFETKQKFQKYCYLGPGIKLVEHMGIEKAIGIYSKNPSVFKTALAEYESGHQELASRTN